MTFTAQVSGAGPLVKWTATGGSITPGPSATATYTAGSTPGIFAVTATSVDAPSQSQTVAVTIAGTGGGAGVFVRGQTASISSDAAGNCQIQYNGFHQPLSTCPRGTQTAPADFTEFHARQRTFAIVEQSTTEHPEFSTTGAANLDVSASEEDGSTTIRVSGSTTSEISDYVDAAASPATGAAAVTLQIEVKGGPASYRLVASFNCDSYAFLNDSGQGQVSFSFADNGATLGPSIPDNGTNRAVLSKSGVLQPGVYTLILTAGSRSIHGRSVGFHTSWGLRLVLEPQH